MGFRIKTNDMIVEVDTEAEFLAAVRVLRASGEKPMVQAPAGKPLPLTPKPMTPGISVASSKEDRLLLLYDYLRGESRGGMLKIIKHLASSPEWVSSAQLNEIFKESSGMGGTIASIGKQAVKFGLEKEDVLIREQTKDRLIRYRLAPAMTEIVKAKGNLV